MKAQALAFAHKLCLKNDMIMCGSMGIFVLGLPVHKHWQMEYNGM